MDPAFPDLVADSTAAVEEESGSAFPEPSNDDELYDDSSNAFVALLGGMEIAATRLW
jgi:hypothetical protein